MKSMHANIHTPVFFIIAFDTQFIWGSNQSGFFKTSSKVGDDITECSAQQQFTREFYQPRTHLAGPVM